MKNISQKQFVAVILSIVALGLAITTCAKQETGNNAEETSEASTEAATEETETEEEVKTVGDTGLTEEEWLEYVEAGQDKDPDEIEGDVSVYDDEGEQEKKIGSYYVSYNGSYATSGSILTDGVKTNMIIYNDGNEDDIKGYFIATPLFDGISKPTTIDQCKSILSEYIPAGTGTLSMWEETDNFFIRLVSGYSTSDSSSVMMYTFVPKRTEEANVYQVVLSASKKDNVITPISEEAFNSAVDPLKTAASDSEIFSTDYEETKESLVDIAYYETSTTDSLGGLQTLAAAHRNYLQTVYGTTDLSELTAEEIDEAYWKYSDPRGYAEYQYYENGIGELDENGNVVVE